MTRPKIITLSPSAPDADSVSTSQTPGAAGNLTITGALATGGVATFGAAAHVDITSAGNDSARTFTVTGTDRYGRPLVESIAGANAGVATTLGNFLTVTQVAIDGAAAGAVTVGNDNTLESGWFPWNYFADDRSIQVERGSSPNFTWTLQHTNSDVQATGFKEEDADADNDAIYAAQTGNALLSIETVYRASRIAITAFVAGDITYRIVEDS